MILWPSPVLAGMPSPTLTDLAEARLDAISFFLLLFLLCGLLLKWAWNVLATSFPILPRLTVKHAMAMMLVSSLFLYVILTMISGARELMTPGAWTKVGTTYQLLPPERDPKPWLETARIQALERLRDALWDYAAKHEGKLPPHAQGLEIEGSLWTGVHPQGERYGLRSEAAVGKGNEIVVFEPESYGATRFVIRANSEVQRLTAKQLSEELMAEENVEDVRDE